MKRIAAATVAGKSYDVRLWEGGDEVRPEGMAGVDTETLPIVEGSVPDLVTGQFAWPSRREVDIVWWDAVPEYIERNFGTGSAELVFHNAGFDMSVLGWRSSKPLSGVVEGNRLVDTGIRHLLKLLSEGYGVPHYPRLNDLVKRYFRDELEKKDAVRLTFERGMRERGLPQDHAVYAARDAIACAELRSGPLKRKWATEDLQVKALIVLSDIQRNGLQVDMVRFGELRRKFLSMERECLDVLSVFGFHPGLAGNQKVLLETLQMIERMCGTKFRRTEKTGRICTADDALEGMDVKHPFFLAYKRYVHIHKMLSTYLDDRHVGPDGRVHPFFNPLVRTGRTSARGPNTQNPPREEGLREQYVAKPGNVLIAIDFSQLELCTLAQANLIRFGFSRQGERINEGMDCHVDTSAPFFGMEYADLLERCAAEDPEALHLRQMGKCPNFGYPGGMGPSTLVTWARTTYGITDLDLDKARGFQRIWHERNPEMRLHLDPPPDNRWTVRNVENYARKEGIRLAEPTPECLKRALLEREREKLGVEPTEQWLDRISRDLMGLRRYIAKVPSGRVRTNCSFTSAANTVFQGFAADGFKMALWMVYVDGWKIVNQIHDELIVEVKDDRVHESAKRISELMVRGMRVFVPDFRISVEATAMRVWSKAARPTYDADGRLIPWEPAMTVREELF